MSETDAPGSATTKDAMRSFVGTIKALVKAERERDEARAALDRVRAVAERLHYAWRPDDSLSDFCTDCGEPWPCPIIEALATLTPVDAEDGGRDIRAYYGLVSACKADSDGDCEWVSCPQLRDGEPVATGRHCPLDGIEDI